MVFSAPIFLFGFLPFSLLLYYFIPQADEEHNASPD